MKIIFLCGSLEPGCDGVGDYVRRLGGELIRQGHKVAAVALNDPYLKVMKKGVQQIEGIIMPILRIPSVCSAKDRFCYAKAWIDEFAPDWLSLQYVPNSFQAKGLPIGLSRSLAMLGEGRRWHMMFHELWVGMEQGSSAKQLLRGWIQRFLVRSLILQLSPAVIHTQTRIYQFQLAKLGFNAAFLPLFGNIPVHDKTEAGKKVQISNERRKKPISLVVFGKIRAEAPIEDLAEEAATYTKKNKQQLSLVLIGRSGKEQEHWASVWKSAGLTVAQLGEQTPSFISEIFANATLGISTTPALLTEKSGAVAAMKEHGLPVLSVARPWSLRGVKSYQYSLPPKLMEFKKGNFETLLNSHKRTSKQSSKIQEVALMLMDSLIGKVNAIPSYSH